MGERRLRYRFYPWCNYSEDRSQEPVEDPDKLDIGESRIEEVYKR